MRINIGGFRVNKKKRFKNIFRSGELNIDSNGIYDYFDDSETGEKTDVEKYENDIYLIDIDGEGNWDYEYDFINKEFSSYIEERSAEGNNSSWILLFGLVIVIVFIVIIAIFSKRKNKGKM